jgi:hypothetical protein
LLWWSFSSYQQFECSRSSDRPDSSQGTFSLGELIDRVSTIFYLKANLRTNTEKRTEPVADGQPKFSDMGVRHVAAAPTPEDIDSSRSIV